MTHETTSRRRFLGAAATAVASIGFLSETRFSHAQTGASETFPSELYKSWIIKSPTDQVCEELKAAGFDGAEVQAWDVSVQDAGKGRLIAEKHGLKLHSVMRGWANFNQEDKYQADVESVKTALRAAAAYGGDTVLLVPCRVGGMKMPEPWDFQVDFDPKTLRVKTVVEGDNAPYADYIAAQNKATEATVRAVESLIPTAAREGVRITIENVWNNLWCTPKFFAAITGYFDNPWVGAYFDLGNHTKYARCEEWIKELGHHIVKLHIKGYKVDQVKGKLGGGVGDWCKIDESSIDWKSVRKLLAEKRYNGWVAVEENKYDLAQYAGILDRFNKGTL